MPEAMNLKYTVTVTRTTTYHVEATNRVEALDKVTSDMGKEIDQTTYDMRAVRIDCPVCGDMLTDRCTRTVEHKGYCEEEPSYCDTCDSNTGEEEL